VLAHDNLAITFAKSGQLDQAIAHSNEALRIKPDDAFAHNNLGLIFTNCGRLPEAIDHLELAIRSKPNDAVAYYNYGNALVKLNRIADAIQRYQEAVRYRPHYAAAWNNLAAAYADLGRAKVGKFPGQKRIGSTTPNSPDGIQNESIKFRQSQLQFRAIACFPHPVH
jgi:tetratricopeptide (TPR) repeat protein